MSVCALDRYVFPPLPYEAWRDSKETLHRFVQIVGKIRMACHPKLNHWWHVTLYPSSWGLTTGRIPYGEGGSFELSFNFISHTFEIRTCTGDLEAFPIAGLSVAAFCEKLFATMERMGLAVAIKPCPYELSDRIPFPEDTQHRTYDADFVHDYWLILNEVGDIFEEFRGRFTGKASPVHLFWHSLDLAYTRFSGSKAPSREGGTRVDQEAYSHEVVSFGFWPGDATFPQAAFYSYTAPAPNDLSKQPLKPAQAFWGVMRGSPMALLRYDDFRQSTDPRQTLLDFMESAYQAGATLANWPMREFTPTY